MIAKCTCRGCGTPLEYDAQEIGRTIPCPQCSAPQTLRDEKPKPTVPSPSPSKLSAGTVNEIRRNAVHMTRAAYAFFILGGIVFILSFLQYVADSSYPVHSTALGNGLIGMGTCVTIGSWFYLVAQLVHIRANTQK